MALEKWTCDKCGHEWVKRLPSAPVKCSRCQAPTLFLHPMEMSKTDPFGNTLTKDELPVMQRLLEAYREDFGGCRSMVHDIVGAWRFELRKRDKRGQGAN